MFLDDEDEREDRDEDDDDDDVDDEDFLGDKGSKRGSGTDKRGCRDGREKKMFQIE